MNDNYRIWTCDTPDTNGIIIEVLNPHEIDGVIRYFCDMGYVLIRKDNNLIRMIEKERTLNHGR